jgi:DNA-binding winged helix-turn-helix (wHTH) protein
MPPLDTKRWVVRRKAAVVNAVRSGAISLEEACRRYQLSLEEFLTWERVIEARGVNGLRVTRLLDHKIRGLDFGADDDFLTKPFDSRELITRTQASGRRSESHSESTIRTGNLVVNLDTRVVSVDDQPVHLTGKEYGILELLSLRKGTPLTKEMFLNQLYCGMDEPEPKIIDVFVCKLRKKLAQATGGEHYIETVWGRGYVLRDPAEAPATGIPGADSEALGTRRGGGLEDDDEISTSHVLSPATARVEFGGFSAPIGPAPGPIDEKGRHAAPSLIRECGKASVARR